MNTAHARARLAKVCGPRWCKRLGAAGFAFFLIKGLAWLIVPFALYLLG